MIPELRTCTVMFIDFLEIVIGEPDTCLTLQSCIELVLQVSRLCPLCVSYSPFAS